MFMLPCIILVLSENKASFHKTNACKIRQLNQDMNTDPDQSPAPFAASASSPEPSPPPCALRRPPSCARAHGPGMPRDNI